MSFYLSFIWLIIMDSKDYKAKPYRRAVAYPKIKIEGGRKKEAKASDGAI
jgi:hypothetical protein